MFRKPPTLPNGRGGVWKWLIWTASASIKCWPAGLARKTVRLPTARIDRRCGRAGRMHWPPMKKGGRGLPFSYRVDCPTLLLRVIALGVTGVQLARTADAVGVADHFVPVGDSADGAAS